MDKKNKAKFTAYLNKEREFINGQLEKVEGQINQLTVERSALNVILKDLEKRESQHLQQTVAENITDAEENQVVEVMPSHEFVISPEISQELEELDLDVSGDFMTTN